MTAPGERVGRIAGLAALASVASWLGALQLANAGAGSAISPGAAVGQPAPIDRARELLDFHASATDQALATTLRCVGLMLAAAVGIYLYSIVRARRPDVSRWMLWSALAGATLVAGASVFGYVALGQTATAFVSSGARTTARARHLIDGSGLLQAAAAFDLASRVVFAVWIGLASSEMMRVGLLERFLAYWGFGACVALVVLPIGDAMFIGWLGSIGVLALGYWPGGRPEAWRTISVAR
ncbi:MAG TPA: hypothetical protein VG294_09200 [Solirubrobacteraceae bacterium]|jgi:hypothetical protein|nr:hypothetical protein [Solirubrobacteraceae bacterium]